MSREAQKVCKRCGSPIFNVGPAVVGYELVTYCWTCATGEECDREARLRAFEQITRKRGGSLVGLRKGDA